MKKTIILISAAVAIMSSAFTISNLWKVAEGTAITFELPGEGTKGTVGGLTATLDFDKSKPSSAKLSATVDMKTFDSGDKKKDDHLKSADFFDVEKFPTASFSSVYVKGNDRGMVAAGHLTIKDVTKPVEIIFNFEENEKGGAFKGVMEFSCIDFGIMKKEDAGKDKVMVTLAVPVMK